MPDADAQAALAAGTHKVPLVSPQGDIGSASPAAAQSLLTQGYQRPSNEMYDKLLKEAKFSSPTQQAITAVEGVGEGVAGPLAPMLETAMGASAADIRERRETNPGVHLAGQGVGLVGSAFIPGGQAKVLAQVGKAGAGALEIGKAARMAAEAKALMAGPQLPAALAKVGMEATPIYAKIGTAAAAGAIENAVFQAGDEITRAYLSEDPGSSLQSAIPNIGLSALIGAGGGAAFGSIHPVWEATVGPKVENLLTAIKSRANGETVPLSAEFQHVMANAKAAGVEIPSEMRAAFSENPELRNMYQTLRESGSSPADALRQTLSDFKTTVGDQMQSVFGTANVSAHEAGDIAKTRILDHVRQMNEEVSAGYRAIEPQRAAALFTEPERRRLYDTLVRQGQDFGARGSPMEGIFRNFAERVLPQQSAEHFDLLVKEINSAQGMAWRAANSEKARALSQVKGAIEDWRDRILNRTLGPEAVAAQQSAKQRFIQFKDHMGELVGAGKLGKVGTEGQLIDALDKIPSAKFAEKLFDKKNIEGLRFLKQNYPEVFETLVAQKKSDILQQVTKKGDLLHNMVLDKVNGLPKEVRDMVFTPEELKTINSSGQILREANVRMNPSGSGMTIDKLMSHLPAGVGAIAGSIIGHSLGHGAIGGVLGGVLQNFLGKTAPDAAKIALLKFLGSAEPISAPGIKSAVEMIQATIQGDALLSKATKAVYKAGVMTMAEPSEKDREKLDKRISALMTNPESLIAAGGRVGHYLPQHATALGVTAGNAVNYLNGLKPKEQQLSPLDAKPPIPKSATDNYHRALDIAEQPLIVLQSVKDGTLTTQDVQHLASLYPNLHEKMKTKLSEEMAKHVHNEGTFSYPQRMSLSLFLQQPLDSTLTPGSMMAMRVNAIAPSQAQESQQKQGSMKTLKSFGKQALTPDQSRELAKTKV